MPRKKKTRPQMKVKQLMENNMCLLTDRMEVLVASSICMADVGDEADDIMNRMMKLSSHSGRLTTLEERHG